MSDSSISAFLDAILTERDSFQLFSQLIFHYGSCDSSSTEHIEECKKTKIMILSEKGFN
jgi:hypothetical protein